MNRYCEICKNLGHVKSQCPDRPPGERYRDAVTAPMELSAEDESAIEELLKEEK